MYRNRARHPRRLLTVLAALILVASLLSWNLLTSVHQPAWVVHETDAQRPGSEGMWETNQLDRPTTPPLPPPPAPPPSPTLLDSSPPPSESSRAGSYLLEPMCSGNRVPYFESAGSMSCACEPGWSGPECSAQIDVCAGVQHGASWDGHYHCFKHQLARTCASVDHNNSMCLCNPSKDLSNCGRYGRGVTEQKGPDTCSNDPNIVIIVVDTLRADHVPFGAHQNALDRHPRLRSYMERESCLHFRSCASGAPWTRPSHSVMLSGREVEDAGIMDPDHDLKVPLLHQLLPEHYTKIAFVQNGNLSPDTVSDEARRAASAKTKVSTGLWLTFGWSIDWNTYEMSDRGSADSVAFLESMRGENSADPFLLFFHTNVVHDYPNGYAAQLNLMDDQIGDVLDAVDFDDTIVVFASDHGEGLDGDLNRFHHSGRMHQDLLHVPLVFWIPPHIMKPHWRDSELLRRPCALVDVVPTILHLHSQASGCDRELFVDGTSLKDLLPGQPLLTDEQSAGTAYSRVLRAADTMYAYWPGETKRSYVSGALWKSNGIHTSHIQLRSELMYPLKWVRLQRGGDKVSQMFNIAYDPMELVDLLELDEHVLGAFVVVVTRVETSLLNEFVFKSPIVRKSAKKSLLSVEAGPSPSLLRVHLEKYHSETVVVCSAQAFLPEGWATRVSDVVGAFRRSNTRWNMIVAWGASSGRMVGRWGDAAGYHYERLYDASEGTTNRTRLVEYARMLLRANEWFVEDNTTQEAIDRSAIPFAPSSQGAVHPPFAPTSVESFSPCGWVVVNKDTTTQDDIDRLERAVQRVGNDCSQWSVIVPADLDVYGVDAYFEYKRPHR